MRSGSGEKADIEEEMRLGFAVSRISDPQPVRKAKDSLRSSGFSGQQFHALYLRSKLTEIADLRRRAQVGIGAWTAAGAFVQGGLNNEHALKNGLDQFFLLLVR